MENMPAVEVEPTALTSLHSAGTGSAADGSGGSPPLPIPDHILQHILSFLKSHRDRNSASLVCKSWYKAEAFTRSDLYISNCYSISPRRAIRRFPRVRSLMLKGKPHFAYFNLAPPNWGAHFAPWLTSVSAAYTMLEKVYLTRMSLTNEDLAVLARSYPRLKELTLYYCSEFGTAGLAEVVGQCRQLRVLDLIYGAVMDDKVDWISCFPKARTCLESLMFDSVKCSINFKALEQLVARSPLLRTLKLNQQISIGQLHRLMVQAPQLTHLGTGSFSSSGDLEAGGELNLTSYFAASKSLTILSGFYDIMPKYLPAIFPIGGNLSVLDFSDAYINGKQLSSVVRHCHKLQNLWVHASVCDEGLLAVAETCKDLLELQVYGAVHEDFDRIVSEVGLLAISEGCRQLRSIIYICRQMTNAALVAMSQNCLELVKFHLCIMEVHKPDPVTGEPLDEGIGAVVRNCKKLTKVGVSGLLTDKAFSYIGKYGKLLETLTLFFTGENDVGLTHVLEGCPKLQKLEIRGCPFGDLALLSGLDRYYNMRFVWMYSCKPSRKGCKEIARRMPRLVVEVCNNDEEEKDDVVDMLYIYPSLEGPRKDAPKQVELLEDNFSFA